MSRLLLAVLAVVGLAIASLFIGVSDVTPMTLIEGGAGGRAGQVLIISRIPRTLAIILAGTALGVAGLIMQMLTRNRFVEPSTAGTSEAAGLGLIAVTILAPQTPVFGKMLIASAFALAGTVLFLAILKRVPMRSVLIVPLVGLMLGGVIEAVTTFFAYRHDLLQTLSVWSTGDFSGVLRGRYELLWIGFGLTAAAYVMADQLTVSGLGRDFATSLGLNYRRIMALGLGIVALITAAVVVTVGMIPFLGLIVPNVVSLFIGDNARRTIPWIAVTGAGFVLACDIVGRVVRQPYEIPVGTVAGVVGAGLFLVLLLRGAGAGESVRHG